MRSVYLLTQEERTRAKTFIIKIINKQNSTWQGSITWVDKQKTQNFRSALEMLKMIDEVLDGDIVVEEDSRK